jgi:hypothetical protein
VNACMHISKLADLARILVSVTSLHDMEVFKCFMRAIEHTMMLLNVPVSEQLRWEDHSPDKINHWSLPSELLSLNVTDLPVANFIFWHGGQSRFTKILQIFRSIGTLSLEFPVALVRIINSTHPVAKTLLVLKSISLFDFLL